MPPRVEAGRGELKVSIPLPILRAFKQAIHDPIRGRSQYGKAGSIVTGLIRGWLISNGYPMHPSQERTSTITSIQEPLK